MCERVRHLKKKVCIAKGKLGNVNMLEQMAEIFNDDLNMDNLFNLEITDFNFINPFNVKLKVEEKTIKFQIDIGLFITVISLEEFHKINLKKGNIQENDINLKAYTDTLIIPMGFIRVNVWFRGREEILKLYVIKGGDHQL